jgi:ATP-dependent 26S proteasome regulatory subunit
MRKWASSRPKVSFCTARRAQVRRHFGMHAHDAKGKTLLAKAVANQTSATFLRIVGSELIQKYLGDGPKLVRELFRVAEENAPSIVFIDEIDAVGTKRYEF